MSSAPDSRDSGKTAYPLTPEEATSFESVSPAGFFDRKKVLVAIAAAFALVVGGGLLVNTARPKKRAEPPAGARAARSPEDFLRRERDRALEAASQSPQPGPAQDGGAPQPPQPQEPSFPQVSVVSPQAARRSDPPDAVPPPPAPGGSQGAVSQGLPSTANRSPLVPLVEGGLFPGAPAQGRNAGETLAEQYPYITPDQMRASLQQNAPQSPAAAPAQQAQSPFPPDPYTAQNDQPGKQRFYGPSSGGGAASAGYFLQDNALWPGSIVPAVLETAISTDLPGSVTARVTENIYDSLTGSRLLIPQGTVLTARYNSSVSYAQHRVQIVWDTLVRPDGFYLELEGMNAVDPQGMSGQAAEYHENWFEYLKAAGIITLFSVANSKMSEEASKYSDDTAAAITQSSAAFVQEIGGSIVSRAMNIQPSLTVPGGSPVSVMLNKTLYLPPMDAHQAAQKYVRY